MQSLRVPVIVAVLLLAAATPIASASARDSDFQAYLLERAGAHRLTVDEYLAALRTQEMQQNVVQSVRDDPKSFGGIYWDWTAATPEFVVQYVGGFAPDFGPGLRYVQVKWSGAQLDAALEQVVQLSRDPKAFGWVSAGIDEVNNTVSVEVLGQSTVLPTQFAAIDDLVTLRVSEARGQPAFCNTRTDCTPHRGGIQINGDIYSCALGANARFNTVIRTITSGHCDTARNNQWDNWNHWNTQGQDTYIGHSHFNGLHSGLDVDVLRIGVVGTQTRNPYNRIYSSEANRSVSINSVLSNAQMFVGLDVRRAGQFTQKNGDINGPYYKYWFSWDNGVWSAWGIASSATSISGDSGGPVWHFTANGAAQLLGFNSLADGTFATEEDAARVLDLDHFCTDSDC